MTTPCSIIPFPTARQVGKVRSVAEGLAKRADERKGGEGFWRQTIDNMARRMTAAGLSDDVVDREISSFRDAVSVEFARLCDAAARRSI